jgi:PHD/YefM family antitoxin component YafN of YafNO toxin-antitoxin module
MYITDEKGGKEAVILPFEEYKEYIRLKKEISSIKETFYLMKNPKNREELLKAISDVEKEIIEEHELIED